MIDKTKLQDFVEDYLKDSDCFLTDLKVSPNNEVTVEIDSDTAVDLDFCIALNHAIEEAFPSDVEDYELEVGSAGLTSPLKTPRQFKKHCGHEMEVFAGDGKKYTGLLVNADDDGFTLRISQKVKKEGEKRPVIVDSDITFPYSQVRKVSYLLKF